MCVDNQFLHPQPYHTGHQHVIDICVGRAIFLSSEYLFSADKLRNSQPSGGIPTSCYGSTGFKSRTGYRIF
jgi:hypothetical protein